MKLLKRIVRGIVHRFQTPIFIQKAKQRVRQRCGTDSAEYKHYLDEQLVHTIGLRTKDASFRYEKFIAELLKAGAGNDKSQKVLCVGCRNTCEIDALERQGFKNVVGADLFSSSPKVLVMDMHDLKFDEGSFSILYCAATFEKAYDPSKVAREFIRVLKNGGILVLQVGANYKTGEVDRHDFKTLNNLYKFFEGHIDHIYFQEEELHSLQTIFKIRK